MLMYEESSSGGDAASDDSLELIEYYQVCFMDLAYIFSVLLATKSIVERGFVQSWLLSACTGKVQASSCLKHSGHACMHDRKPLPTISSQIVLWISELRLICSWQTELGQAW